MGNGRAVRLHLRGERKLFTMEQFKLPLLNHG